MNNTQEELLKILSSYINSGEIDFGSLKSVSMNDLLKEANNQKVSLIVMDGLLKGFESGKVEMSSENKILFGEIKNELLKREIWLKKLEYEHNKILRMFFCAGIRTVVIKGRSISCFYPNPILRSMGDLDIYVDPSEIERASNLLLTNSFIYERTTTAYHREFNREGISVELHNSFPGLPEGKTRKKMLFLRDLCNRGEAIDMDDFSYFVPCMNDNGLVQLCHVIHHIFDGGITLSLVIDWNMFASECVSDEVWYSKMQPVFDSLHLSQMAKCMSTIGKKYLGFRYENASWFDSFKESDCIPFVEYIFCNERIEKNKAKGKTSFERTLSADVWGKKSSNSNIYYIRIAMKNLIAVLRGERSIKKVFYLFREKKKRQKLLAELKLVSYRYAKDFSME